MKKVSIIMPTYKRDLKYVQRALESLLNQSYENLEIIVVDDSPTSYEYRGAIGDYVRSIGDPRISYYMNETNLGGALSRNVGIFKATGYYTTFLDDDDRYLPDKVKAQVEFMDTSGYDMSFSNMLIKTMGENLIDVREYSNIWSFEKEELLKYHLMRHATGTPTFMYKTEALQRIGGFDDARMGQEFYLMLKTIEQDLSIGYLDRYDVVVYRHKGEAISTGMNKIIGERELQARKMEYFDILDKKQKEFLVMRHYAVLAIAYKRNGKYPGFIYYSIRSFFASPMYFVKEGVKFVKKVLTQRKIYKSH